MKIPDKVWNFAGRTKTEDGYGQTISCDIKYEYFGFFLHFSSDLGAAAAGAGTEDIFLSFVGGGYNPIDMSGSAGDGLRIDTKCKTGKST